MRDVRPPSTGYLSQPDDALLLTMLVIEDSPAIQRDLAKSANRRAIWMIAGTIAALFLLPLGYLAILDALDYIAAMLSGVIWRWQPLLSGDSVPRAVVMTAILLPYVVTGSFGWAWRRGSNRQERYAQFFQMAFGALVVAFVAFIIVVSWI